LLTFVFIATCTSGSTWAKVIPYKDPVKKSPAASSTAQTKGKEDPAITRTRQQVKMLDDLYKTAVVLITEHYVTDPSILSAATASKALFAAMKKNGWHDARLIGFTDVLYNADENSPQDAFEKKAKEKLLSGKGSHEEVITKNGKRFLRVATPVPVVMERCIMCHANFKGKEGPIGSIAYTVPVVE
jgi:hypothetical protein